MSIRSYIAMVYALTAIMVFGLAEPGGVTAGGLACNNDRPNAAVNAYIDGEVAKVEVDDNWLGWLMWEPAVFHVPADAQTAPTVLTTCGAAEPQGGPARIDLELAVIGDLHTVTLPVITTATTAAEDYMLAPAGDEDDLPAYLDTRPGQPETAQEPVWLVIESEGHEIEIWSETHAIDVSAVIGAHVITLAPDADLTRPVLVVHYRLTPEAPRLAAKTAQGA